MQSTLVNSNFELLQILKRQKSSSNHNDLMNNILYSRYIWIFFVDSRLYSIYFCYYRYVLCITVHVSHSTPAHVRSNERFVVTSRDGVLKQRNADKFSTVVATRVRS